MKKISVVVRHSPFHRKHIAVCFQSIRCQGYLPYSIDCGGFRALNDATWNMLLNSEYVCFVDSDDCVINDSINKCYLALENNPSKGIAFTDQMIINSEGHSLDSDKDRIISAESIATNPQTIHHLAMLRTSMVNFGSRYITDKFVIGYDWLIKAETALRYGYVHVPEVGYLWRQHSKNMSRDRGISANFMQVKPMIQEYLKSCIT